MSDLIDLNSPDGKKVAGPKLASPLIPAPTKLGSDGKTDLESPESRASSGLNYVKRSSLDNNPFDNALHKTAEYISKREDPFEVVLEKALKFKEQNVVLTPKARSVEFKDDFTPKRTRHSDILKMNKTLDDSLMEAELNMSKAKMSLNLPADESIIQDLDDTNLLGGGNDDTELGTNTKFVLKNGRLVPKLVVYSPNSNDLSILNQSAMNDSLTESSDTSEEFMIKSIVAQRISMCIQRGTDDANDPEKINKIGKNHKLRRSLSQGDKTPPRKFRPQRSQSIMESLKAGMENEDRSSVTSISSVASEGNMNKGFLLSRSGSNISNVLDLSNISSIQRLTSVSSALSSSNSSAFSNCTANNAFIESSNSNCSGARNLHDRINSRSSTSGRINSTNSIASILTTPLKESVEISDLTTKFSHLKAKNLESRSSEVAITRLPSLISGFGVFDKSVCDKTEDKLIDVDVFVPAAEQSPPLAPAQRQLVSSSSSDSVFLENSITVGKSILAEATNLAKTFEELAGKTVSSSASSAGDDLVNSRPRWNFDLLPSSDDEILVENLIELPNSPAKLDSTNIENTEEKVLNECKSSSSDEAKSEKSILKDLETEFIVPEKKIIASTLLLDLEKLVKSEGNPEAEKLLQNLEKALGLRFETNSELLATCFADKNDLTKSPKRSENALAATENIKEENREKSCEDNFDIDSSESLKQLNLSHDKSLHNNLNIEKTINKSDKSLVLVCDKFEDISPKKIAKEMEEDSCDKIHVSDDDSISAIKQENHITDDQKMAVEILVGLGKLLTGENKDPMTANVLKKLGMVLNLASSKNHGFDKDVQTSAKESQRADTPAKNRIATPTRKSVSSSALSRSANRRSFESSTKTKTTTEKVIRRSISVTQTPTSTTPRLPSTALSADKSKAHLKDVKKRFSSDPGFVDVTTEKKKKPGFFDFRATNNRKPSATKDIPLKPVVVSELTRKEQPSSTIAESVKSKLRKKTDSDVTNKKGPMKALLPLGNMQRRGSLGKKVSPLTGAVTPPKPGREPPSDFTVTTSTPYPIVHLSLPCPKKSPKTKPMASSTPDFVVPKESRRSVPQVLPSPRKNSFSCNISPVTSKVDENNDINTSKDNSRSSKSGKMGTPSKSHSASQLPKLSPMPAAKKSPNKSLRTQRRSEPLQSFLSKSQNPPKSPGFRERLGSDGSASPLKNINKLGSKVKPLNLISKLRRRSGSPYVAEKENQYASS